MGARQPHDAGSAIEGAELVIPSLCWEDIDESVDDIMFDALSPDMDGRYPDIEAFAEDLMPLLGSAREGKTQLAQAVKDSESLREEPAPRPPKPYVPFIDRLGMRGSNIVMRVFAALGAAMLGVVALLNFRFDFTQASQAASSSQTIEAGANTVFGLFSTVPIAAWAILAVLVALAALWPRFAMPAGYGLFVVALFFNQAWLPAFLLLAGTGAWWWFFGRRSDMMATLVMLQPLFGSIGFAALVPVLSGALLDIRDAVLAAGMAILSAFVMASMGSGDIMNWEVMSNFIVAVNPSIAGASISGGFVESLSSAQNQLACRRGALLAHLPQGHARVRHPRIGGRGRVHRGRRPGGPARDGQPRPADPARHQRQHRAGARGRRVRAARRSRPRAHGAGGMVSHSARKVSAWRHWPEKVVQKEHGRLICVPEVSSS